MENRNEIVINRPPVLFKETQKLIKKLEQKLGGSFLSYWSSGRGSVCHNDVVAFYRILQHIGKHDTIYIFLKSSGGNGQASLRIVNLLRQYGKRVVALIPLQCASAATMISIGADEIQMGPLAYLTAVDTSLTHELSPVDKNNYSVSVSQDELNRVIRLWEEVTEDKDENPYKHLYNHIHPLVFGAIDRASSLSVKICKEILSYHLEDEEKMERISWHLNSAYPSHSYPITLREAQKVGLNVTRMDEDINTLLLDLNELFSEMGQKALTDYDETNYHDNEILNIVEGRGIGFNYQNDRDWHYRKEERRWIPMNDESAWYRLSMKKGEVIRKKFHIQ
jgi:hypothetical protein